MTNQYVDACKNEDENIVTFYISETRPYQLTEPECAVINSDHIDYLFCELKNCMGG